MATTKVVFALDHATNDGKVHKGGSTVAVDSHEARALLLKGVVQLAKPAATPEDDGPDKGTDKKAGK